jgi:hypothetical protein
MADKQDQLDQLYARAIELLGQARSAVARTINAEMVQAYWQVGMEIVDVEQSDAARATCGEDEERK